MTTRTPRQEPAIPFRTMSAEEAALRRDLAAHRETLSKSDKLMGRLMAYRKHDRLCEIDNTEFCTCGLKETADECRDLHARIQSILKNTQAEERK